MMAASRVAVLHVGAYKTGSQALHAFLAGNAAVLTENGVRVVSEPEEAAWSKLPFAVVSSARLLDLHRDPARLRALVNRLREAGFMVRVLAYVRAQAWVVDSLLAQCAMSGQVQALDSLIDSILATGAIVPPSGEHTVTLLYTSLLAPFVAVCGRENVIVRPYREDSPRGDLFVDFVATLAEMIGLPIGTRSLRAPIPSVNDRPRFIDLFSRLYERARSAHADALAPETLIARHCMPTDEHLLSGCACLITHEEALRFFERFRESNRHLSVAHNTLIPFVSRRDVPPISDLRWDRARVQRELLAIAYDRWNLRL